MTVNMVLVRPAQASQTHVAASVGPVAVSSTTPVRLPHRDDVQAPRMHVWVGSRGLRCPIRVAVEIESDGTYLVEVLDEDAQRLADREFSQQVLVIVREYSS